MLFNKKERKKSPIIYTALIIVLILLFISGRKSNKGDTEVINELIENPIEMTFKEIFDGISDSYESEDLEDLTWTAANVSLGLNKPEKAVFQKGVDLDKYFIDNNWTTETIGFTYVSKDGSNSTGYMYPNLEGELKGSMCIVYRDIFTVACGFGPGGEN